MTFSQKLKYILSEQNISQAELSRLTGINKSSICQYLSGKNIPSKKRQDVIATAIGMSEDYFGNENFKEPSIPYPKIPRLTLTETAGIMGVSQRALALAIQQGMYSWAQIKTTNILQSMQWEKWDNRIPDNYYIQVLHYLLVTEYDFVVLKAQLKRVRNGEVRLTTKHYHIEREEVLSDIKMLKEEEEAFWHSLQSGQEPGLLLPEI